MGSSMYYIAVTALFTIALLIVIVDAVKRLRQLRYAIEFGSASDVEEYRRSLAEEARLLMKVIPFIYCTMIVLAVILLARSSVEIYRVRAVIAMAMSVIGLLIYFATKRSIDVKRLSRSIQQVESRQELYQTLYRPYAYTVLNCVYPLLIAAALSWLQNLP